MFCTSCGSKLDDDAVFCSNCGFSIRAPKAPSPETDFGSSPRYGTDSSGYTPMRPAGAPSGTGAYGAYGAGRVAGGAARAAGSVVKHTSHLGLILGIIGAVAALVIVLVVVVPMVQGRSPEQTIKELETALNKMDMDAMMDLCDASTKNAMSGAEKAMGGALGLLGDMADLPLGDFFDLGSGLGQMMSGMIQPNAVFTILKRTDIDDTHVIMHVRMSMDVKVMGQSMGAAESEETDIPLIKDGNKWYITLSDLDLFSRYIGY